MQTMDRPTTFTFDSPIYLQEGTEYAFVTMTNSLDYKIWISQMGEQDVSGTKRVISSQPHLGSLFKSQNNRTWDAIQSQDKKFTLIQDARLQLVVQLFHYKIILLERKIQMKRVLQPLCMDKNFLQIL